MERILVPKCQDNVADPKKFAKSEYIILQKMSELSLGRLP